MDFVDKTLPAFLKRRLLIWFENNGRSFPWRGTRDPYAVWVSEIMLQQTTTQTVRGYYDRFLAAFPDTFALATASEDEVLRLWEGLGYYRRAKQLHAAAKVIVSEYCGIFPREYAKVLALPGVGRYTAGAVLSIAFDQRLPILEANTIRLYSRLMGLEDEVDSSTTKRVLWEFAEKIIPTQDCGRFNQALMDFGAMVCLPTQPDCTGCVLSAKCRAAQKGLQEVIPVLKKKQDKVSRVEIALLVSRGDETNRQFLIVRYPEGGRWVGLCDFPRLLQHHDVVPMNDPALLRDFHSLPHCSNRRIGPILRTFRHTVTRYNIILHLCDTLLILNESLQDSDENQPTSKDFLLELAAGHYFSETLQFEWVSLADMERLAFHSTARRIFHFIR